MYVAIVLSARIVGGILLSIILGILGAVAVYMLFLLSDASWPRGVFVFLWLFGGGLGAGAGGFLPWMNLESSRRLMLLTLFLILLAGLAGAFGGYFYKVVLNDEQIPVTGRVISSTGIFGATIASNLVAVPLGVLRQARSGWLLIL